jgi:hypothetical protein
MKKILLLVLLISSFSHSQTYCALPYITNGSTWTLITVNGTSLYRPQGYHPSGYYDLTGNLPIQTILLGTNEFSFLSSRLFGKHYSVWLDINKNGIPESGENIIQDSTCYYVFNNTDAYTIPQTYANGINTPSTMSFTVPSLTEQIYRMRVIIASPGDDLLTQYICNDINTNSSAIVVDFNVNYSSLSNYQYQKDLLTIYPNPANDHITIDCGTLTNVVGYNIKITNTLGQEIFNQPMNTQQYIIPLTSWTGQGVYFVNIIDGQGHTIDVKKIILQ